MLSVLCKPKYTLAKICVKSSNAIAHSGFVCIISPKGNIGTHAKGTHRNFLKENLRGTHSLGTHDIGTHSAASVLEAA
jgi:hypothetical protein